MHSKSRFEMSITQIVCTSVVMVLVVVTAYGLGYRAGRDRGLVLALEATEGYLAKLPVSIDFPDQEKLDAVASKVYASLSLEGYEEQELNEQAEVAPLIPSEQDTAVSDDQVLPAVTQANSLRDRLALVKQRKAAELEPAVAGSSGGDSIDRSTAPAALNLVTVDQGKVAKGWYVQITAPTVESEALDLANLLNESGFPVVIERAVVQQRTYFRVLVGPEAERITAERLLQQLLRERYIDKAPFIRRVK